MRFAILYVEVMQTPGVVTDRVRHLPVVLLRPTESDYVKVL